MIAIAKVLVDVRDTGGLRSSLALLGDDGTILIRADGERRGHRVEAMVGGVAGGLLEAKPEAGSASLRTGIRERSDGDHPSAGIVGCLDHVDTLARCILGQYVASPLVLHGGVDVGVGVEDRDRVGLCPERVQRLDQARPTARMQQQLHDVRRRTTITSATRASTRTPSSEATMVLAERPVSGSLAGTVL